MDLLERLSFGPRVVVLLSGGRDSVCLLDCAARSGAGTAALHVNYGLRGEEADEDEAFCRALCDRLGVDLVVERPPASPRGNVQAWARDVRYAAGDRLAQGRDADLAAGHTADDQVETVLYRLAASPGRRALLGMRGRDGRLVRPLLGVTREETAAHCRARGLTWREDSSNEDPAYARNRIRAALLPALREIHPAAAANVLRTLALLRDEAEVLDAVVDDTLRGMGWPDAGGVPIAALAELAPPLRRLALQRLADAAVGGRAPAIGSRAEEILALRAGRLDLGAGLCATVEHGTLELLGKPRSAAEPARAARLAVPGRTTFGGRELIAELGSFEPADGVLDREALGDEVEVRCWRPGDRMRPLGLGGTKTLQDLFTDRKVPRSRRARVPVVVARGEIAWVPGVATGERFRAIGGEHPCARLRWVGFDHP